MRDDLPRSDVLRGTLDLMILKTLDALGAQHGYGIARRLEQLSRGILRLQQGSVYPALVRLQQKRLIASSWGVSDTGRSVKFYTITPTGRRRLATHSEEWNRVSAVVNGILNALGEG